MSINLINFAKSFIYETTAPVAIILLEMNEITNIVKTNEVKANRFKTITICSFICLCFAGLALVLQMPYTEIILWLSGIIGGIYGGFMWNKYACLDLLILRHRLSKKVLEMLTRDLAEENNLNVRLVLTKTIKNKPVRTIVHPYLKKVKINFYTENWLKIEGYFLDGTHFSLIANELSQIRSGWRRGISGRNKYKSKSKAQGLELSLTLTYLKQKYCPVETLQERVHSAVKIPKRTEIEKLKVTDKSMNLIVKMSPYMSDKQEMIYKTITMMFLSLYQVLNWTQILSKQQVGKPRSAPATATDVVGSRGRCS